MSDFVRTLLGLVLRGAISKSKRSGKGQGTRYQVPGASKDSEESGAETPNESKENGGNI